MTISRQIFYSILLFFTIPAIYFYPFSFSVLSLSLLLGFLLKKLLSNNRKFLNLFLFIFVLAIALLVSGHKIYSDMAIANVTNSQRGEHQNYRTNIIAKVLHNKSTAVMYYLQNFSDRLSVSTIFASGAYPNISKFLPLGFLFPWYLLGFILSIRHHYRDYLDFTFMAALSILFILTGILAQGSAQIFMFAVIWFIGLQSVEQIVKLPKKFVYSCLFLNLVYLGIFLLSYKSFLVK